MSDYNSSLPVRTQTNGDLAVFISDGTTPSQVTAVDTHGSLSSMIKDSLGNAVTTQANGVQRALDVGINVAGVQIDPRSIRALTSADVVSAAQSGTWNITNISGTVSLPTGAATSANQTTMITDLGTINTSLAPLNYAQGSTTSGQLGGLTLGAVTTAAPTYTTGQTDALSLTTAGALRVDGSGVTQPVSGTVTANQGGSWSISNTSFIATQATAANLNMTDATGTLIQGSKAGGTAATNSALIGAVYNTTLPTLTTGQQASLQLDSDGSLRVDVVHPLPAGTNAIGSVLANLQVSSAAVSLTNPVPVTVTSSTPGTPIQDYHTSAALAAAASVTFTYTVVATHTFSLERIWSSASGKIKVVVNNNGSPIMVGFNSTANPNIDMTIVAAPTIAAGNTVTVVVTNEDKAAFDVYATIEGNQN